MATRFHNTLLFLFCLNFTLCLWGQPLPCEDPPTMTPFCSDACIICDIDGFTGVNNGGSNGEAPPGFCTSTVHNGRWIAFIAGSESLTIQMSVSNCQINWGLELGIYEGNNCGNFNLVSNCDGSVDVNSSAIFQTNAPLTIGQYYYIVMDGNGGDVCEWTFNVLEGSTQVDPLTTSGLIFGNFQTCPNRPQQYLTTGQTGATEFLWTIDGETVQDSTANTLETEWSSDGTYELCVTAFNACDVAPPTCQIVTVSSLSPTLFNEVICTNETFVVNDTIEVSTAGNHEFTFKTSAGCDSVVRVTLEVIEATFTDITANICEGDSIFVGDTPYFQTGQYVKNLPNLAGCDSTVNLDLNIIICEMQGTVEETPVVCFGESSGQLNFAVTDGTPPFNYVWEQLGTSTTGSGSIENTNENTTVSGLQKGTYLITINDLFGNDLVLIQEVTEPTMLTTELNASDFNGSNVSCFESEDGSLEVLALGGVSPYNYFWSTGENGSSSINDLAAENYTVTITDDYGCNLIRNQTLTEPSPLRLNALFTNPNCNGLETGELQAISVNGGIGPYLFDNSGSGFAENQTFSNLSAGTYTLTVRDANGCETDTTAMIIAPIIPQLDLGENPLIFLGDEITLQIEANIPLDSVLWSSLGELSCLDCPNPTAQPFSETTYSVQVVSEDGCATEASVTVNVEKRRRVAVPTAFSPNEDGINDDFVILGGPEVSNIRSLQVFTRWGEKIFTQTDFLPNDAKFGWDGFDELRPAQNGVYVWWAEIEFIDGETLIYQGNVTLLR